MLKAEIVRRGKESQAAKHPTVLTRGLLFLLIYSYVIKCSDQVKHETEKMYIIVKGAEKFLGLKDV